jgi:hypothetical protein
MTDTTTIETRNAAHRWLVLHIRYSRYDTNFIDNVSRLSGENKALTKRQDELWERLVHKYRKQIKNNGWDAQEIVKLNWLLEPVDFDVNYSPLLWFENGELCCRFPYNQRVVKEIRSVLEDHNNQWLYEYDKRFQWSKERRCWHGEFYPALCKSLIEFANDNEFEIDYSVQQFADRIPGTDREWMPVAEYINGRVYVSNLTTKLADAFDNTELTPDLVRDLVALEVMPANSLVKECAKLWGDSIAYLLCFREVTVAPEEVQLVLDYLTLTTNDVVVQNTAFAAEYNADQEGQRIISLENDLLLWPHEQLGEYIVYSDQGDNYTLDKGIDCLITTDSVAYSMAALRNISKKIVVVK